MKADIAQYLDVETHKIRCGCYVRLPDLVGTYYVVPLRHIDYELEIANSLVNITLKQKYFNPTDKFLEVDYSLPLNPDSSVYRFEAEFGAVKIEGVVKEKEQAKREFEQAKSEGRQAVIGTLDPDSKDILNLEIGNIPPLTEFTVTISLLQQMKVSQNTFYRLQVPSTISPRFMNKVEGKTKVSEHMEHKGVSSGKPDFDWSFKVDLRTTRKVVFFDSPSHDVTLLSQNEAGTETLLVMEKSQVPNKDFVFVYTTENFHLPSYVVGSTDTSSTVMLSFIPKFCALELTDAYKAAVENKPQETDMAAAKGDYVFLLDRSGSMGGTRINKAKEALVLFLKSLPADSYFNVISFGNNAIRMFGTSQRNQFNNIERAVAEVHSMNADMGGTQIYQPLNTLLQQKVIDGYPRHVFLLTDGQVSNTQGVISMVKKNTKHNRVHSIGIGNGASFDLIQGCANNGKGKYVMIADGENPAQKIIELLETTLTPLISKIDLKYDFENQIQSVVPNPKSIPYILKDEAANFYITFQGPISGKHNFSFEYEDSVSKLPYKATVEVDPAAALNQPFANKMAHLKVLRALENAAKEGVVVEEQMHYVKVKDFRAEAVRYSVKHQVLSEFTAFLCVGKELVDGQFQEFKNKGVNKIHVQQHEPQQYTKNQKAAQYFGIAPPSMPMPQPSYHSYQPQQQQQMRGAFSNTSLFCAPPQPPQISQQSYPDYSNNKIQSNGLFESPAQKKGINIASKPVAPKQVAQPAPPLFNNLFGLSATKSSLSSPPPPPSLGTLPPPPASFGSASLPPPPPGSFSSSVSNQSINSVIPPPPSLSMDMPKSNTVTNNKSSSGSDVTEFFKNLLKDRPNSNTGCLARREKKMEKQQLNLLDYDDRQDEPRRQMNNRAQKNQSIKDMLFELESPSSPKQQTKTKIITNLDINSIVQLQSPEGYWSNINLIQKLAQNVNAVNDLTMKIVDKIVITKLVVLWMQKHHPEKQYALIIKKALSWLKKQITQKSIDESELSIIQTV